MTRLFVLLAASAITLVTVSVSAAPDDPYATSTESWQQPYPDQWALQSQRIYADIAPQRAGDPVVVAVIDTGVDYTHEDLAAEKFWWNPNEERNGRDDDGNGFVDDVIGWNFVDDSNNPWDLSGHGTHIAGVIAACTNNGVGIAAVNADALIMPLKVANFAGQARSSNVAAAIYYAVDNGAKIINLSLGGELITELEIKAAEYAQEQDVLIVVSSGNRGISADKFGYAGLPGVLGVGASDTEGERAGFSNFGNLVHMLAPGVDVLSLRAENTDFIAMSDPLDYEAENAVVDEKYYRANGTSFAAALASGVASKVLSMRPDLTIADLRQILLQSAQDIEPPGVDLLSGHGAIDYVAALGRNAETQTIARIETAGLTLEDNALLVEVRGVAAADEFSGATLFAKPVEGSVSIEMIERTQDLARIAEGKKPKKRRAKKSKKQLAQDEEWLTQAYEWQQVAVLSTPVQSDLLATLGVDALSARFHGATEWEIKLTVQSETEIQEAFMTLSLPIPSSEASGGGEE